MRYVDTGSRNPEHALGTWLEETLIGNDSVTAMRVQSGFFNASALGFFEAALNRLTATDGVARLLLGSNNGELDRASLETLVTVAGPPRSNLQLGVVSFQNAFFHSKVFHFERSDGSQTAYVGSANMTAQGTRSQHVEAGLILDTLEDDPSDVLGSMADTIDAWFVENRAGMFPIASSADLDTLASSRVIGVERPKRTSRTKPTTTSVQGNQGKVFLSPLVPIPALSIAPILDPDAQPGTSASSAHVPTLSPSATVEERWSKTLARSDAQRKASGNQRGAISLVQGNYKGQIHAQTYFRQVFFSTVPWTSGLSRTKQPMDTTQVPMRVRIDGIDVGPRTFTITHAPNREAKQNNYASTLHLAPLRAEFASKNMTGKKLEIERYDDGSYSLTIA